MFLTTHQLTEQQLSDVQALLLACKRVDGNELPVYPQLLRQNRSAPGSVLCYLDNQLIGFAGAFFFYEDACELALMVLPEHRRQGIANALFRELLPLLHQLQLTHVFFSAPEGRNQDWFLARHMSYRSSEYHMQRQTTDLVTIENHSLGVRLATETDIPILIAMDKACFDASRKDMSTRFQSLLNDAQYSVFIAIQNGVPVGKAHLCWFDGSVRFTDVAIIPRLQGQGLGRTLLSHCINYALADGIHHMVLDVETDNRNALSLYTHLGFSVSNAYDYWMSDLTTFKHPI